MINRALKRTANKAGIEGKLRVYDLRLTCASQMQQNGVPDAEIQKTLGHKNIQTTLDLYVKTGPEMLRNAADIIGEAIAEGAGMSKIIQLRAS